MPVRYIRGGSLTPFARRKLAEAEAEYNPRAEPAAEPAFTITPARYAKRMNAVRCHSDGSGFKTRAARLACALRGRYSSRERAYIMSPAKSAKLARLHAEGWDASTFTGELNPPAASCDHPPRRLYSWQSADGVLCVCCCNCGKVLSGAC